MNTSFLRLAKRALLVTLLVYALLAATHEGEFWPFSIYPMFSQAGQPWTRALVRTVSHASPTSQTWESRPLQQAPGLPYGLKEQNVNQNDIANFVSKTKHWDAARLQGLRRLLYPPSDTTRSVLVCRVQGHLKNGTVQTTITPLILFAADTTFTAPSLKQ